MNKIRSLLIKVSSIALVLMLVFTFIGCKNKGKKVELSFTAAKNTIVSGERIKLNTEVKGTENTQVTWEISNPDIVTISYDNYLSVIQKVTENVKVTIKAISVANEKVTVSKEFTVIAPKITVSLDKSSLKENESANISVNVDGLLNKEYTLSVSDDSVVKIENNTITVINDVLFPKSIIVTATSNADKTIVGKATIDVVPKDANIVKMTISSSADTVEKGETITFSVEVTGHQDTGYTWTVSKPDIVKIENNVLSVIKDIELDQLVSVTATSTANPTVSVSKSIVVKAPKKDGQVGELTSQMLQEIGNQNITVTGKLKDIYQDFNQPMNNRETAYEMEVKMSEGAWSGEWQVEGNDSTKLVNSYRKGTKDGIKDQYGNTGHALEQIYIDKNNSVARTIVKDYASVPAVWEAQHLYNHLDNFNIEKFEYDPANNVYEYKPTLDAYEQKTEEELYFLTYLSVSLTPMLSDTLDKVYLTVEDGKVSKLLAQTEAIYYGASENQQPDALSYTTIEVTFSNIGTTIIEDPKPFEAPQHADKLANALEKMQNAKNYTFQTIETTTSAPSGDSGDYEIESVSTTSEKRRNNPFVKVIVNNKVHDYPSSIGTVGCMGQVTENAALFATTTKYSYSMDGKNYVTKHTGLKQNADGTYDEFAYNTTLGTLEGTKKVNGNIFDNLPTFDFSPNVFEFTGSSFSNGVTKYIFTLRETRITRDVAMEFSIYNYATNADASLDTTLQITVDENGNLLSTVYPYQIIGGTYQGYVTTTYSKVGETQLPEDTFEGYIPRVLKTSWSEYTCKYYSPDFSTQTSREENAETVFRSVFGDDYASVPSPSLFLDIMGDNVYGPFYNWKKVGTDPNGNEINHGYVSINTTSSNFDENAKILDYEELMAKFETALKAEGFMLSVGNTDMSGGKTGLSDRYVCYIKGNVQIVITNNHTKYISIYFYITGDWILNRN